MRSNGKAERLILRKLLRYLGGVDNRESTTYQKRTNELVDTYIKNHKATHWVPTPTQESAETTIRRALRRLEEKGLVEKVDTPGKQYGSYVGAEWQLTSEGIDVAIEETYHGYHREQVKLALKYGKRPPEV